MRTKKGEAETSRGKQELLRDAAGQNSIQMKLPGKPPFSPRCSGMQPDVVVTGGRELLRLIDLFLSRGEAQGPPDVLYRPLVHRDSKNGLDTDALDGVSTGKLSSREAPFRPLQKNVRVKVKCRDWEPGNTKADRGRPEILLRPIFGP